MSLFEKESFGFYLLFREKDKKGEKKISILTRMCFLTYNRLFSA